MEVGWLQTFPQKHSMLEESKGGIPPEFSGEERETCEHYFI